MSVCPVLVRFTGFFTVLSACVGAGAADLWELLATRVDSQVFLLPPRHVRLFLSPQQKYAIDQSWSLRSLSRSMRSSTWKKPGCAPIDSSQTVKGDGIRNARKSPGF
jgi:hypothetical protein